MAQQSVAEKIKSLADLKGWNSAALSRFSGVPYNTVHDIMIGKTAEPEHDTICKLAAALQISPIYLYQMGPELTVIESETDVQVLRMVHRMDPGGVERFLRYGKGILDALNG
ncbi:MAG: helix-turn-helix domain-containing protein [Lachnospiraceae bacterium]|nr:helix-turn-helix domain-containing protein [Lachnospiraceae bacterium]